MSRGRRPGAEGDRYVFEHARQVLDRLMAQHNTTEVELGLAVGLAQTTVSDRRRGRSNLTLADVYKAAGYFGTDPRDFFPGGSNEESVSACTRGAYGLTSEFGVAA